MSVSTLKMAGLSRSVHVHTHNPSCPSGSHTTANPRAASAFASPSTGPTIFRSHPVTATRRDALPLLPPLASPADLKSDTYIRLASSASRSSSASGVFTTNIAGGIRIIKFVPLRASLGEASSQTPSSPHSPPPSSTPPPSASSASSSAASPYSSPRLSASAAKAVATGRRTEPVTETVVGPRFEFVSSAPYVRESYVRQPTDEELQEVLLGGEVGQALDGHAARVGPSSAAELSYELVQGALVRWTEDRTKRLPPPPTAVLIHGILGSGKNWGSFARRLATEFPTWQFLCVDLRCHGNSTAASRGLPPHTVHSAAKDVLQLMGRLRLTPRMLIGHSFGGKVALSMIDQAAKPLPSALKVWVLDATPGRVRAGGDGEDHPADLIEALRAMPPLIYDRRDVVTALCSQGFSKPIAQWMTTNLTKAHLPSMGLLQEGNQQRHQQAYSWSFDLEGISHMYSSYETTNMWHLVEDVPEGVHINFLRAERSLHRWARDDIRRIVGAEQEAMGHGAAVRMHVLEDAGHWVHTDNPDGLFQILAPSFGPTRFRHH